MQPEASTDKLATQFPLEDDLIYLNHAALGPWPQRTVTAIHSFAEENLRRAALNYSLWMEAEAALRQRLATLIQTPDSNTIAIVKNTSEALSVVAAGFNWQRGDNVVLADHEFPSNRQPWRALEALGVDVRLVAVGDEPRPHERLMQKCDAHTRVLTTSSVHYASGVKVDLDRLGDFCRHHGIFFGVDAIQSLGALPLNVATVPIDFLACGSHKWLMAPEGIGFLYTSDDLRQRLTLHQYGWRMAESPFAFEGGDLTPAQNARRFEPGTLNTLGMVGLNATLSLFEEIGSERIATRVLDNTGFLIDALDAISGLRVVTPSDRSCHAGIVSVTCADSDRLRRLFRNLKQARVISAIRDGKLRLSPHFHTPRTQLVQTVELIEQLFQ